jgi:hypothetical protein
MAVLPKATRPGVGTTARFHTNECRGQLGKKHHPLRAVEPFAHHNRAMRIHTHEMKHLFCKVNTALLSGKAGGVYAAKGIS